MNEFDQSKKKGSIEHFDLFWTTLLYIDMKNYKNIACTDFVNVNIALNLHSYEESLSFILEFIKRVSFVAL